MSMKSWVLHRVQGARRSRRPRRPRAAQGAARARAGSRSDDTDTRPGDAAPGGPLPPSPEDLGAYAPLIGAVRDELEHFVASHVRLHVVIADRDRFMLTAVGVRSPGGAPARQLLQEFMREFRPEQVKRYLAREVIGRLPNAAVIDLSQFAGLSDLEARRAGPRDGRVRGADFGAADRAGSAGAAALRDQRPRPLDRERCLDPRRTRLAGRRCEFEIDDGDGPRHAALDSVVPGHRYIVGKGDECDIRVNGTYTSRRHAELWLEGGDLARGRCRLHERAPGRRRAARRRPADARDRSPRQAARRRLRCAKACASSFPLAPRGRRSTIRGSRCARASPARRRCDHADADRRPGQRSRGRATTGTLDAANRRARVAPPSSRFSRSPNCTPVPGSMRFAAASCRSPSAVRADRHWSSTGVTPASPVTMSRSTRSTMTRRTAWCAATTESTSATRISPPATAFAGCVGQTMVLGGSLPGEPQCKLALARRQERLTWHRPLPRSDHAARARPGQATASPRRARWARCRPSIPMPFVVSKRPSRRRAAATASTRTRTARSKETAACSWWPTAWAGARWRSWPAACSSPICMSPSRPVRSKPTASATPCSAPTRPSPAPSPASPIGPERRPWPCAPRSTGSRRNGCSPGWVIAGSIAGRLERSGDSRF